MGLEWILFTYAVGLIPIFHGIHIVSSGRVYLSSRSTEPIRGTRARLLGFFTLVMTYAYYSVITRAWSVYDR